MDSDVVDGRAALLAGGGVANASVEPGDRAAAVTNMRMDFMVMESERLCTIVCEVVIGRVNVEESAARASGCVMLPSSSA
jgi:hypothetical protein